MARKYTMRSKEEKLAIVKAVLAGRPAQYYENNVLQIITRLCVG